MKKLTTSFVLLLCAIWSYGQIQVSVIAGAQGASVTPKVLTYPDTATNTSTQKAGIVLGLTADFSVNNAFYIRTGVIFSGKGSSQTQTYDTTDLAAKTVNSSNKFMVASRHTELRVSYIDIPISLMYKLSIKGKTKFMIGGGPHFSLLYGGNKKYNTIRVSQIPDSTVEASYEEEIISNLPVGKLPGKYRTLHLGANAFAGFDFGRVSLTVYYSRSLNEFLKEDGRSYKHKTIGATIGFLLN